jgi:threonine dehydrogenase-like Zn-dependent dehydrogenase
VIDAVGMEAHGSPGAWGAQQLTAVMPDSVSKRMMNEVGVDRLSAFYAAIHTVRRGGTISLIGVYGGQADPFANADALRQADPAQDGQANVKRWVEDIMPLLMDGDPLGVEGFATHRLPMEEGPRGYEIFQKKEDNAIKVLLQP